jgi:hypothetical protein
LEEAVKILRLQELHRIADFLNKKDK